MATRRTSEVSTSTQKSARRPSARGGKHSPASKPVPAVEATAPAAVEPQTAQAAAPAREEIAALAYSLWEKGGRTGGSPEQNWLDAERELLARNNPGR
jgi:hypothetical protein